MSKITDALKKAVEDRATREAADASLRPQPPSPTAQTRWEEVQRWEATFASARLGTPPAAAGSTPVSQERIRPVAQDPPAFDEAARTSALQPPVVSQDAWEQAIQSYEAKLLEQEQRAAHQQWEAAVLAAQVAAHEQAADELAARLGGLRQQLAVAAQAGASVQAEKAAILRRLSALRDCRALSHACRMAKQELAATTQLIAQAAQSQQRMAEELTRHQQRSAQLQQAVATLQTQLTQALAQTDIAAPPIGELAPVTPSAHSHQAAS